MFLVMLANPIPSEVLICRTLSSVVLVRMLLIRSVWTHSVLPWDCPGPGLMRWRGVLETLTRCSHVSLMLETTGPAVPGEECPPPVSSSAPTLLHV